MNAVWVVFGGAEPDLAVIGCAASIETVVDVIAQTVYLDYSTVKISLPFTDRISIEAMGAEFNGPEVHSQRSWRAEKHSVAS